MEDIFEEIVRLKREGKRAALATVVSVKGSAPREEGAKMLVREDGSILGSVGGGSVEAQTMQEAAKVMAEGKAKLVHFDLTGEDAAEEGMICGGVMDIFVELLASRPTLYIFGAGHISVCLAEMARMAGFRIVVADDRVDFANRERFPQADAIIASDFASIFSELNVDKHYIGRGLAIGIKGVSALQDGLGVQYISREYYRRAHKFLGLRSAWRKQGTLCPIIGVQFIRELVDEVLE